MEKTGQTVSAIDRAFDIINFLYENQGKAKVTEISAGLGLYQSTVHRILNTMRRHGYIYQDASDSRYGLGQRFYLLGMMVQDQNLLAQAIRPLVSQLVDKYGETVHVSIPDTFSKDSPKQITILLENASSNILSIMPHMGIPTDSHCSASGKCILAYAAKEYVDRFRGKPLRRFTDKTIVAWDRLDAELEQIHDEGFAIDHEELEIGLMCIAVPIKDTLQRSVGALSITGPIARLSQLDTQEVVKDLQATVSRIF